MDEKASVADLQAMVNELLAAALEAQARHERSMEAQDDRNIAGLAARDALHAMELERRDGVDAETAKNFRAALESRDVIGQAKGIIMATMACDADQAFELLRQQSRHENRKLVDIANEIANRVASRARATGQPRPGD